MQARCPSGFGQATQPTSGLYASAEAVKGAACAIWDKFKNRVLTQGSTLIYRQKDVVEKGFLLLKANLDLGRLRVHRDDSMQNKVFIGFVALILMFHLHKVMLDKDLYKSMTMKKLLLTLSKLRVQHIHGQRILFSLTKQKAIYKAFAVNEPM